MKRAGKVKWGELKVGILIAIGIAFMLYASFRGGGTSIFEAKNDYTLYCSDLDGLSVGSPVWLAGVEVGNVKSVKFLREQVIEGKNIEVQIRVTESIAYLITPGTVAQLATIGLLGDKYVRLVPGPSSPTSLEDGSVIPSEGMAGLQGAMRDLKPTIARFNTLVERFDNVLATIDTSSGLISALLRDPEIPERVSNLIERTSQLVTTLDRSSSDLSSDIRTIKIDFHALSEELLSGQGTLGKLMTDPAPFESLVSTAARLDTILAKIEDGEGTAGQLVNDQELYDNIKDLMARMNTLTKDIMDNPRKYFKFSVF